MLRQFQSEDSLDTRQSIPATDFSVFIIKTEVSVDGFFDRTFQQREIPY